MKKLFTLFAAVMLLASVSFAQGGARRGQTGVKNAAAAFKAQVNKKQASKASAKAAGDTISVFPWTEGFENGTTGFTFVDSDNDGFNWMVATSSVDNFSVNSGDACIVSASYDNDNQVALTPDNWMILPVMQIPSTLTDATLSWYEIAQDANYANEYYSVYITTSGHAVSNFTATTAVFSATATGAWVKRSVDLSSYAGQTIHIAFRHYNCTDMFFLNIDDIRIGGSEAPELTLVGPASARLNEPVTFTANSTVNNIAWTVDGTADATAAGTTLTTTFTTIGMHQVIATATNSIGSVSDTIDVNVYSCEDITLPFVPDFSGGLGCWDTVGLLTQGTGWFPSVDMFESNPVGQVISISAQNFMGMFMMDIPVDNWLISPEITMPTATGADNDYEIAWQVRPYLSSYQGDHYGVYVISGTDTTMLYEESLTGITDFVQRMAVIPSTITGDFQVAFRHFNSVSGYVIVLDSIQIRSLSTPVLTLQGPTEAENGVEVTFTAVAPNATSFSWTVDGTAVAGNTTNVLNHTFTADGSHTVAVTATNSVGTATDDITVSVYTCEGITSFPYTLTFENGHQCWDAISIDPANNDRFGLNYDSTFVYEGNASFLFSSYNTASDYNQYLISPELTLPATGVYVVTFPYKARNEGDSFRIMASSTDKNIASFTEIADYPSVATEWTVAAATLPAGTKYVAINYYGDYQYYLGVDNITIQELNQAPDVTVAGPASAMAGDEVTFTATAPLASSFSWTVDGNAVSETSNVLTTSFTTAGDHTVTVTATNTIGSNTASAVINIVTCDPISSFPYAMGFESNEDYGCWRLIDADGDGYNWQVLSQSGSTYGHNSANAIASASYVNSVGPITPDNYLVMPAIQLPAGSELILSWFDKGQDSNYAAEHYSVVLSTTGNSASDFTTVLYDGTSTANWIGHNVSLGQYAGQTVYIAFRHHGVTDMFYLDIDDIKIAQEGVGIDVAENNAVSVYPNPATSVVTVSAEGVEGAVDVQLVDLNGRVVMQQSGNAQGLTLDVSGLSKGVYFVRLSSDSVNTVSKLVVK